MPRELKRAEDALHYKFNDSGLLREALTHPSYSAEQRHPPAHNQRLEFLGDAVLQHAVTVRLFHGHPELSEGALSRVRSALTNEEALVGLAKSLDLGSCLLLGRGEEQSGGRDRDSVLADAMEAVVAAIYLDGGMAPVDALLERHFHNAFLDPIPLLETENPKGALQELAQERFQAAPSYEVLNITGPEHEPVFEVRVLLNNQVLARAEDRSRKSAEKQAAHLALQKLHEADQEHVDA